MFKTKLFLLPLAVLMASGVANAQQSTDELLSMMDNNYEKTANMAQKIWDYAELGYLETQSSNLLKKTLAAEGFEIEEGVAGIPTSFVATYGTKGPVIGILAEFDALPGLNQAADPFPSKIPNKNSAHACGHNLFSAGSVSAAIAVKNWLIANDQRGIIKVFGTPAEEGGSGKVYMVREGLFDNVDFVIHWHPSDSNSASALTTLANRSAKFRFKGVSSHAAAAPENGRSALDAVEAFNYMVNMMREHVPQETRIHYVITEGGTAPNVVPDFAEAFYYVRHPDADMVRSLWARVENAAKAAALGTGTEVEWEIIHGNLPVLPVETLSKVVRKHLARVGGVEYNVKEQEFADKIYKTLSNPRHDLGSEKEIQPYKMFISSGSTDVGDVSMVVPTVGFSTATYVPGTSAHSWQSAATSGTSIGFKGAHNAAKTMALMAIDLYQNKELRKAARIEFDELRGKDFKYEPLLGDRKPPLDYRK
jgi:aminobenzoyl-glutamate utilization protein B